MGIYHRSDVNFRFIKETVFFILIDNRIYAPGIHCGDATIIILHKLAKGKLHKLNRHNTCWHEIILFCTGLYSMDKISREARQCHHVMFWSIVCYLVQKQGKSIIFRYSWSIVYRVY